MNPSQRLLDTLDADVDGTITGLRQETKYAEQVKSNDRATFGMVGGNGTGHVAARLQARKCRSPHRRAHDGRRRSGIF